MMMMMMMCVVCVCVWVEGGACKCKHVTLFAIDVRIDKLAKSAKLLRSWATCMYDRTLYFYRMN